MDTEIQLPVLLSIRGEQYFDGEEPNVTELMTDGILVPAKEEIIISYQESALTGMEGTTTAIHVAKHRVILTRSGVVNSHMVFEAGRQHTFLYETPYGKLSMDILTSSLHHDLTVQRGGSLEIRYAIAMEHTATGRNRLRIHVKRKNNERGLVL